MRITLALTAAALVLAPPAARAAKDCGCEPAAKHAEAAPPDAPAAAAIAFPDEALVDQHGATARLLSDVIGDRIAVVDFIFTTCTTICPLLSGIMARVQEGVGDAADVALVSVTVDPARDTPQRLAAYAKKWDAGPRWTFLTGEKEAVRRVLEPAGAYTADFTAHPPMFLVGDGRSGTWVRLNGFPQRAQVLAAVEALREKRRKLTASAGGAP